MPYNIFVPRSVEKHYNQVLLNLAPNHDLEQYLGIFLASFPTKPAVAAQVIMGSKTMFCNSRQNKVIVFKNAVSYLFAYRAKNAKKKELYLYVLSNCNVPGREWGEELSNLLHFMVERRWAGNYSNNLSWISWMFNFIYGKYIHPTSKQKPKEDIHKVYSLELVVSLFKNILLKLLCGGSCWQTWGGGGKIPYEKIKRNSHKTIEATRNFSCLKVYIEEKIEY